MPITQVSEHVLRITEQDLHKIREKFRSSEYEIGELAKFLDVDDAEVMFGTILEVYIEDPVRMIQFKFDWSE